MKTTLPRELLKQMIFTCKVYDLVSRYLEVARKGKIDVEIALELSTLIEKRRDKLENFPRYLHNGLGLISNWADYLICYNASRIARLKDAKSSESQKDLSRLLRVLQNLTFPLHRSTKRFSQ